MISVGLNYEHGKSLSKKYDVVVVGGGLSGLMSALYLADHNKSILLLEKEV